MKGLLFLSLLCSRLSDIAHLCRSYSYLILFILFWIPVCCRYKRNDLFFSVTDAFAYHLISEEEKIYEGVSVGLAAAHTAGTRESQAIITGWV